MIDLTNIIGQPEGESLEYRAVLPPARTLAQIISAFANGKGGIIVLGVSSQNGKIIANGLSEDFRATAITHKALDLLSPKPSVKYDYETFQGKRLYLIQVEPSQILIAIEGKIYVKQGTQHILTNPTKGTINPSTYAKIRDLSQKLDGFQKISSGAKSKFIDHCQSVLNIAADLKNLLFPLSPAAPTKNIEGKILVRILFSSCVDNFEAYLSDLLYEIYLAQPETLKSSNQVTVKEVLDCNDIQEFITYYAKKKLSKLQRGSVKGFINENSQINDLKAMSLQQQEDVEKIFQIRHLFAHQNGVVDEKFLRYFPGEFAINDSYEMSMDVFIEHIDYLADTANRIDDSALKKYSLAAV